MEFATADLCDAHPDLQVLAPGFLNYGGRTRFFGPVETLKLFEDNSRVREAVAEPGEGRVLVVDGGASMRRALLGDRLAALAVKSGWAGVVISGCIRDSLEIGAMDLGVRALGTHPRKTDKRGEGQRGIAVEVGGVRVMPGQWLYADEDGIVVAVGQLPTG